MVSIGPPLAGTLRLTSGGAYGKFRWNGPHPGVDFVASTGTPVLAAAAGTVRRVHSDAIGGRQIAVDHGGGVETRYAHLNTQDVRAGLAVAAGQRIGTAGASGMTENYPHLHFELRVNGSHTDPMRYLSANGLTPTPAATADELVPYAGGCRAGYVPVKVKVAVPGLIPSFSVRIERIGRPGESGDWDFCMLASSGRAPGDEIAGPATGVGDAVGAALRLDLSGLLAPALNIGVVVAAVVLAWGGIKRILGG